MDRTLGRFRRALFIATAVAALMVSAAVNDSFAQSQPAQPATGPGGSQTQYTVQQDMYGSGATQYWIATPRPMPASAPVVVFMHGNSSITPFPYQDWIDHIVKRGMIVIYPRYQESTLELPKEYATNAVISIKAALAILGQAADTTKVAWVGHSFGGILEFNIAADAAAQGVPFAKAILAAHPGPGIYLNYDTFTQIPAETSVLVLAGEDDKVVGDLPGINIMAALPHVRGKNLLIVQSDSHGNPPLVSDHLAPTSPPTDSLDYYAYWKLTDALLDFAFYGIEGDIALGGGDKQISMGTWSDGVPVAPLEVRPTISQPGILNAANLRSGPIAPGEVVLITGSGLGPRQMQPFQLDPQGRLTKQLSGTRVLFQGIASPLVYSFMNQVAAIVPYGIVGSASVSVRVEAGSNKSGDVTVPVAPSALGVFTASGSGSGQGLILNQNSSANSSGNPAPRGSQIILYATGDGTAITVAEGTLVTQSFARTPVPPISVTIGGAAADVTYAGVAPGFYTGMLQINVRVPGNAPTGNVPLMLTVGSSTSQSGVTVAVK